MTFRSARGDTVLPYRTIRVGRARLAHRILAEKAGGVLRIRINLILI
jgi:hypothetical protein